jgi:dynein heavy chain
MEKKRKAFPRFYFLSDDELIDILANSRDLKIIQGHLKACFDNCVALTLGDDEIIEKIHSAEKEVMKLKKPVRTKEVIEKWLDNLQNNIKETLYNCLKEGIKDYGN